MRSLPLRVLWSCVAFFRIVATEGINQCGDLSLEEQDSYRVKNLDSGYVYQHGDLYPALLKDFPPKAYLGFGLDMREASPLNIKDVVDAIKRPRRYVKLADETEPYPLPHGNVTWNLPVNVDHNDAEHNSYDDLKTFDNGSQAAERIAESDLVGGSYKSVKGSVSSSASLKKQFDDKHSWAFYAYVFDVVSIDIDEYLPSLNVEGLKCALNSLPKWDTGTIPEEDTIKEYRDLFATSGTHIITAVNFGSRLELILEASNSDHETVENFQADVKFHLQGLPSQGSFDSSVNGSAQYKNFQNSAEAECWVRGGDTVLGNKIKQNLASPDNFHNLEAWEDTAQQNPDITSVSVTELWGILGAASDPILKSYEISVQNAFGYLVQNPLTHYTVCSIVVNAPWAEIGLLTPKASFVDVQPMNDRQGIVHSTGSKINFFTPDGSVSNSVRVQFRISNDGSSIGIELSHGSGGYAGQKTYVTFIAEPTGMDPVFRYNNVSLPFDPSNKEEFWGIPADQNGVVTGLYDDTPTPDSPVEIKGGTAGLTGYGPGMPDPWPKPLIVNQGFYDAEGRGLAGQTEPQIPSTAAELVGVSVARRKRSRRADVENVTE